MTKNKKNKRQYRRFRFQNLEEAHIIFTNIPTHPQLKRDLFNLSYKGLGFQTQRNDENILPLQQFLPADLHLHQEKIAIEIEVLYIQNHLGGARISPKNSGDIRKIIRFISPRDLGESLIPIEPELIRQTEVGRLLTWCVGKNNTELVLWRNKKGQLLEFQLVFNLYALKGNLQTQNLQTADMNPAEIGYIPIYEPWPEEYAPWHSQPNREIIQLATELLEHAHQLPPRDQKEISQWMLSQF
jgi:hypothetical protein